MREEVKVKYLVDGSCIAEIDGETFHYSKAEVDEMRQEFKEKFGDGS